MSNNNRLSKRLKHHLFIFLISLTAATVIYAVLFHFYPDNERRIFRFSLTTAHLSIILLGTTLCMGTWNLLLSRVNPVSSDLRRDIGLWCGLFTLIHVAVGLNVHLQHWTQYFLNDSGSLLTDAFGFANYLGVFATLMVLILLMTSNDISLRRLGRDRWKALQRCNYIFAFLVIIHGFLYQYVEKRLSSFGIILGIIILWTVSVQVMGIRYRRQSLKFINERKYYLN